MLRTFRFITLLALASLVFLPTQEAAALEMVWETDAATLEHFKIEDPKLVKVLPDGRAVIYLRFLPVSKKPVEVGFATKKNYLTCEGKDERVEVQDVTRVFFDRRQGIVVYGFFFPSPGCDRVTFFVKPKILE